MCMWGTRAWDQGDGDRTPTSNRCVSPHSEVPDCLAVMNLKGQLRSFNQRSYMYMGGPISDIGSLVQRCMVCLQQNDFIAMLVSLSLLNYGTSGLSGQSEMVEKYVNRAVFHINGFSGARCHKLSPVPCIPCLLGDLYLRVNGDPNHNVLLVVACWCVFPRMLTTIMWETLSSFRRPLSEDVYTWSTPKFDYQCYCTCTWSIVRVGR